MNLQGKKVLVTGASSGIGEAIAVAFAQKGATVLINYRKNKKGALKVLEQVKKYSNGYVYQTDLTRPTQIQKMFKLIKKDAGSIDILVNNAGDAQPGNFFDNKAWKEQFENIFFSALHVSQNFLKQNQAAKLRKVVNISSVYGNLGMGTTGYFSYSMAKAALSAMTANLAKLNKKVLVNAVAPGYTWTPAWKGISADSKKKYESRTIINRFITAEEIAQAVIMLAENDAITGQIITVDGGLELPNI